MHVAFYHPARIPPLKYGGTERIIFYLAQALNKLGHRTTLMSLPGSGVPDSQVIPITPDEFFEKKLPKDVDIIHLWGSPKILPQKPFIITIQGNGQPGETFHPNTIFISKKHAENHGAKHFVYNGINPDHYKCVTKREPYLVFLAKASWSVKNLKGAIAIARAAKLPLEVLGSRDWPFMLHRLLPQIRGVRYRGMVDDKEKSEILSRAQALLFPVRWHEPFGIAVTEALASGCAVFGTPYGSLPEIVTSDIGFLSNKSSDLVCALRDAGRFSSVRCRQRVFEGFTHIDMAKAYLKYYENILNKGTLGEETCTPKTLDVPGLSQKSLLEWDDDTRFHKNSRERHPRFSQKRNCI